MMKTMRLIFVVFLTLMAGPWSSALDVRVPIKSKYDATQEYPMALLHFILDKSGVKYNIIFSEQTITTQPRQVALLMQNDGINLGWFGTSKTLEQDLVPIRFPLWRGLLGYRVFIINKDYQNQFDSVNTLDDLRRYRGEQGIGWSDLQILRAAGLEQDETQYDAIFEKINSGRAQYFSRGITEAFREVELRQKDFPNLAVERHVLLVYPFDGFFFTNKENPELARALESGYLKAYADGTFLQFFNNHPVVKNVLERLKLDVRSRIDIPNPLLSPETQAIPKQYWYGR